ncbi:MAG: GEVED domain-containing protein [Bacteroidota bacterium]
MKKTLLSMLLTMFSILISQAQTDRLWTAVNQETLKNQEKLERGSTPKAFKLFNLNFADFKTVLQNAPLRDSQTESNLIVSFPDAEGKFLKYKVFESPVMEKGLASRYSDIKSYVGQGIDDKTATIHFSVTSFGLHTMTLSGSAGTTYLDTYTKDLQNYIVYKRSDIQTSRMFSCLVQDDHERNANEKPAPNVFRTTDTTKRTYRLAMACTIEYAAFHVNAAGLSGGTTAQKKAAVLAAMNVTMTRINGIYERDLAVRMNLVANNDAIIFITSDSFSNTDSNALINESQSVIDATIGSANYDIGHTVSTGGGGLAQLNSPCSSSKARGITGQGSPVGDPFDVDYVAHELGHQFGGNHTQNNNCNRSSVASMEPGSGSTIMGYAGICAPNVQSNSDAHFHSRSLDEMAAFIAGAGNGCAAKTASGNTAPTSNAGVDFTIPKGTPFVLKGTGTDANGDALTYCWEQINPEASTQPPVATSTSGPNFRSISPSTSPDRYMPNLATVIAGNTANTWEVVPNVARTMDFSLTIRDNRAGAGQHATDNVKITVNGTAGPFTVSSPNTAVSYAGNSSQTVTWNVAGTTANGVNAANVDILLSTDGGNTYPVTLLTATPNDGTQAVTIPNTPGTQNRIMVRGSGHIFYDISNANFTITSGSSDTTAPSAPTTLAASGTTQTTTNLTWAASTDNVAVTGYDVYQGAVLKATVTTTSYAVTGLTASTAYTFSVRAKDAAGNVSASSNVVNVTTLAPASDTTAPSAPTSLTASGTTQTTTNLSWTASTDNVGVTGYDVYQGTTLLGTVSTTTYNVTGLTAATAYSFSVRAKDAAGNISASSNVVNVTTLPIVSVYCISQGNSVNDELIGRVQIGTINNASTGGTGYTDFTSISTNLTKGASTTITITPTWTGSVYAEGYAVWIDYNNDKDFADAGELVWSNPAVSTTPVSGSFTVPTTATTGSTRMRVSMRYNAIPVACGAFDYGQVEDYTVNLVNATTDTTAPTAPTSLTASGTTQTTTNLSWTASTDNVAVTGYDVYRGATLVTTVSGTSYTATGLTAATAYTFSVRAKDAAGNISASSNVVNVTTLSNTITYCASQGNSVADEFIDYVAIGGIANTTGANAGYGNYTNLVGNVPYGSNTITYSAGFTGSAYTEFWSVWIDYNKNGTFETTEQVATGSSSSSANLTSTFTVPTSALAGTTRMRVSMKYNAAPTACEAFTYGEVEDYTVNIGASAKPQSEIGEQIGNESSIFDLTLYPNPTQNELNIATADGREVSYRIVNYLGQEVNKGKFSTKESINVSNLVNGIYIFEINDGQKTVTKKFVKK